MLTIIFDIDGTLTDLWPLERAVILALSNQEPALIDGLKKKGINDVYELYCLAIGKKTSKQNFRSGYRSKLNELKKQAQVPNLKAFPSVDFIKTNRSKFHFVFATGGLMAEAEIVLRGLGLFDLFDFRNSISIDTYPFTKATGLPFRRIRKAVGDCYLITDSSKELAAAQKEKIPALKILPDDQIRIK